MIALKHCKSWKRQQYEQSSTTMTEWVTDSMTDWAGQWSEWGLIKILGQREGNKTKLANGKLCKGLSYQ